MVSFNNFINILLIVCMIVLVLLVISMIPDDENFANQQTRDALWKSITPFLSAMAIIGLFFFIRLYFSRKLS